MTSDLLLELIKQETFIAEQKQAIIKIDSEIRRLNLNPHTPARDMLEGSQMNILFAKNQRQLDKYLNAALDFIAILER